jgi:hypothetical protein
MLVPLKNANHLFRHSGQRLALDKRHAAFPAILASPLNKGYTAEYCLVNLTARQVRKDPIPYMNRDIPGMIDV